MIIKKYQGKTESDAVELAQKELGPNVVIMNVHNMKRKGFFGVFKPKLVEITVALEDDSERNMPRRENSSLTEALLRPGNGVPENRSGKSLLEMTEASLYANQAERKNVLEKGDTNEKAIEERLDNLQNFLEQKFQEAGEDKAESEDAAEEKNETVAFMQLLYNTMLENDVNEKYANQIIDEIDKNIKTNTGVPVDYLLSNIYQKMVLKFGKPVGITPAQKGPKVIFFIGPTGVGKTTTIAKIASKFRVDDKKSIALLTADTYRIAATDQLRTYANILEVPFRIIYSVEEIVEALEDFFQYDYILIDTAGHSHHNDSQKEHIGEFIHCLDEKAEKEVFLVLSATTKYRDLVSITDTYKSITDFKLIFTKLDETTALGNLLNVKLYTGASLSYITCGQNVPDDIEKFNPQKTVKRLLGGKR